MAMNKTNHNQLSNHEINFKTIQFQFLYLNFEIKHYLQMDLQSKIVLAIFVNSLVYQDFKNKNMPCV